MYVMPFTICRFVCKNTTYPALLMLKVEFTACGFKALHSTLHWAGLKPDISEAYCGEVHPKRYPLLSVTRGSALPGSSVRRSVTDIQHRMAAHRGHLTYCCNIRSELTLDILKSHASVQRENSNAIADHDGLLVWQQFEFEAQQRMQKC